MHEGKPMNQSLAIAYALKRRAKKMANGGMLTKEGYESKASGPHQDEFHEAMPEKSGYVMHEEDDKKHNEMAMHEDERMLNQHGDMEEGPEGHDTMKEDEPHMAHGGMMKPMHGEQSMAHEEDMVGRVMKKRQMMYSKGGMVANDTPIEADFDENDFDYLAKHDGLESEGTDNERGNEYGADHSDPVSKIMMKRRKQHNPRPA